MTHAYSRFARPVRIALIAFIAFALAFTLLPAQTSSAAAADTNTGELVVNGDFSQDAVGWFTNNPKAHVLTIDNAGRNGTKAAAILPQGTASVVLNDKVDTLRNVAKGSSYTLTAWVRSNAPGAVAMIKAREGGIAGLYAHEKKVKLSGTGWEQITVSFTTRFAGSWIDVNVLFWGLKTGNKVFVDSVSLKASGSQPPVTQPPVTEPPVTQPPVTEPPVTEPPVTQPPVTQPPVTQPPTQPEMCTRPAPAGTKFGSSISTGSLTTAQALAGVDSIFGRLPIVRVFDPEMVRPWSHSRNPMIAGRDLVVSFRPSPQDVLSGKYDAEFREWFAKAPSNVNIYWSYIHEPEPLILQGKFTADQYRKAWQRIDSFADAACRSNMHATLILTGWTTLPASKRDWRTYYPGADVIDVMAFDPYNGASNPTGVTGYPSAASMFDSVRKVAQEAGKPYGIAETGSTKVPKDVSGTQRAAWLAELAAYHRTNGAVFVTYFHSSRDGEWRLLDGPSQTAWRAAVSSSR